MRAWKGIKELGPNEFKSFFMIGGFHGEPFRGPGAQTPTWWGGYCQHGTVLFPTWHRAYLYRLENALRSIPGCESVTLPFWDETSDEPSERHSTRSDRRNLHARRERDPNPLRSFVLPATIVDAVSGDNSLYSKPQGYETVRYPLSGLVGTPDDRAKTAAHNARFPTPETRTRAAQRQHQELAEQQASPSVGITVGLVYQRFLDCLDAPNYTLFSNTTSMNIGTTTNRKALVVALEARTTTIHLAVGGFDVPGRGRLAPIAAPTATWARTTPRPRPDLLTSTTASSTMCSGSGSRGTARPMTCPSSTGIREPIRSTPRARRRAFRRTAGCPWTRRWPPFTLTENGKSRACTGRDGFNIEGQLGYTYGDGSLEPTWARSRRRLPRLRRRRRRSVSPASTAPTSAARSSSPPSPRSTGTARPSGPEAVLSRWHVDGCANCQTHVETKAVVPLLAFDAAVVDRAAFEVEVHTRDGVLKGPKVAPGAPHKRFQIEIR